MKLVLFASVSIALASCQTTPKEDYSWIKKGLDVASAQLQLSAEEVSGTGMLPRSIRTGYDMDFLCRQLERDSSTFKDSLRAQPTADQLGKRRLCNVYDWTSGFFPGSLWYAYELTGNDTLKTRYAIIKVRMIWDSWSTAAMATQNVFHPTTPLPL